MACVPANIDTHARTITTKPTSIDPVFPAIAHPTALQTRARLWLQGMADFLKWTLVHRFFEVDLGPTSSSHCTTDASATCREKIGLLRDGCVSLRGNRPWQYRAIKKAILLRAN